jgi:hypothetical protein
MPLRAPKFNQIFNQIQVDKKTNLHIMKLMRMNLTPFFNNHIFYTLSFNFINGMSLHLFIYSQDQNFMFHIWIHPAKLKTFFFIKTVHTKWLSDQKKITKVKFNIINSSWCVFWVNIHVILDSGKIIFKKRF